MLRNTGRRAAAERAVHLGVMTDPPPSITRWRISDLVLDTRRQRVWRGKEEIPLPKLTYALFVALVRRCPDVVADEELMKVVWPGVVVSPETVSQRVKLLRQALKDDPRSPRYVGRLRSRGYHLVPMAIPDTDEEQGVVESRFVDGSVQHASSGEHTTPVGPTSATESTVPSTPTAGAAEPTFDLEVAHELVAATELFRQDVVETAPAAGHSLISRLRALMAHIRRR